MWRNLAVLRVLTHRGRLTHICVGNLTTIGLDNGLSPSRRQDIIWTNIVLLLIIPLGTKFSDILIEMYTFACKKMHLKMSSGKWWPFCLGLSVLIPLVEMGHSCVIVVQVKVCYVAWEPSLAKVSKTSIELRIWITNYIYIKPWLPIIYQCDESQIS